MSIAAGPMYGISIEGPTTQAHQLILNPKMLTNFFMLYELDILI